MTSSRPAPFIVSGGPKRHDMLKVTTSGTPGGRVEAWDDSQGVRSFKEVWGTMLDSHNCVVSIRPLSEDDLPQLQALLENCSEFLEFQDGRQLSPSAAREQFEDRPPGAAPEAKTLFGVFGDEICGLVGIIDLTLDHPDARTAHLGLMLMDPNCRGRGAGSRAYVQVEEWARIRGAGKIRLGVLAGNDGAMRFWKRAGYLATGETGQYRSKPYSVLEKQIAGPSAEDSSGPANQAGES
jgi:GNAT superfamily N-acetyltransferase